MRVVRPLGSVTTQGCSHDGEFCFLFALTGGLTLTCEGRGIQRMVAGDSCVVPAQQRHALTDCSDGLELLEVSYPQHLKHYVIRCRWKL